MELQVAADPQIQFLAYQKPALEFGRYKIQLQQAVKLKQVVTPKDISETYAQSLDLVVLGERFSLNPDAIHAMFPPPGSFGRHSDCLPHLSINRSTFVWERSAYANEDFEPWLALLLFDEQEFEDEDVKQSTITLAQLQSSLDIQLQQGQETTDKVTVIDVKKSLLQKIMPTGTELKTQAHVRKNVGSVKNPDGSPDELAVVIGNRLPRAGAASVVHLVSVEGRYHPDKTFNSGNNQKIRLVSLKSWGFSCKEDDGDNFESLVESISTDVLTLPPLENKPGTEVAQRFLANGYVALPHKLRQCDTTYSWYRGPLAPHQVLQQFNNDRDLPDFGDALTRYHKDIGMFDVSYSAAYELGRSLALEDKIFSGDIYRWKHQYNENICAQLQQSEAQLLTLNNDTPQEKDQLALKIKRWLTELTRLIDIPFNYLVPEDRLLSPHSINFFKLDQHWIESLLYGAFSIGGTLREKTPNDGSRLKIFNDFTGALFETVKTGFLLRSSLVLDYPDLKVAAYGATVNNSNALQDDALNTELTNIRCERLGPEVMLCLFDGDTCTAELYLKPQGLHYGLDEEEDNGKVQRKKELTTEYLFNAVKNHLPKGTAITTDLATIKQAIANHQLFYDPQLDAPASDGGKFEFKLLFRATAQSQRVLDITNVSTGLNKILIKMATTMTGLAEKDLPEMIKNTSSAQFGLHMLEGSNKGRFVVGDKS
jgi:hypothetical protein